MDEESPPAGRETDATVPRRRFLEIFGLTLATATLPGLASLVGCSPGPGDEAPDAADDGPTRVALALLPLGERVEVEVTGTPVELLRTAEGVTARSLRCTHFGCRVVWDPGRSLYVCPCHDGAFDADGSVAYGPPDAPLPSLRTELGGDAVRIWPVVRTSR